MQDKTQIKVTVGVNGYSLEVPISVVFSVITVKEFVTAMLKENPQCWALLGRTEHFVRADCTMINYLWMQYKDLGFAPRTEYCTQFAIGHLLDQELRLELAFRYVGAKLVCFYHMPNDTCKWSVAEKLLEEIRPGVPIVNAANFAQVFTH